MNIKPSMGLFNDTATLSRAGSSGGTYYEEESAPTVISTEVKFRLTSNRWFGVARVQEPGFMSQSSHRGYAPASDDYVIYNNDFIVHSTGTYRVNLSDSTPGGVIGSHYELWMSKVE